MPFLKINGITVRVSADSFVDTTERVGGGAIRSVNGARMDTRTAEARQWTGRTSIMERAEYEALRRLIDGHGHVWHCDSASTMLSTTGISGSGATPSATTGKFVGKIGVASAGAFTVQLGNRMFRRAGWAGTSGFTVICWKLITVGDGGDGVSYYHHIATGAVNVVRGASANPAGVTQYRNGVAGSYGMGNWLTMSSTGQVSLHGYNNANAATAFDYDEVVVLPFAIPASWAAGLYAFHNARAWSDLPKLVIEGDSLLDTSVVVQGMSGRAMQHNVSIAGAHANNARALEFDLFEE